MHNRFVSELMSAMGRPWTASLGGKRTSTKRIALHMLQRFRDAYLLMRLARVRGFESRRDQCGALKAIAGISYEGPYAGFVAAYTARLLAVTRDPRALAYVREVRDFIRENERELRYSDYCVAYCDYLELVLHQQPYGQAGAKVLALPSTAFVRNTLLVV